MQWKLNELGTNGHASIYAGIIIAGKFGGLAVCLAPAKLKSANIYFILACNYMYGDPVPNRQI